MLPVALIAGYFLRQACSAMSVAVPYVIFAILVITFSGVRLSSLRPTKLDLLIADLQAILSIGIYMLLKDTTGDDVLAQGTMMCVLCPVASSVTVVASMLGADSARTTTYTIIGNLLVALIAPVYISVMAATDSGAVGGWQLFALIFTKIATVIALPFIVMLLIQRFAPAINSRIAVYKGMSFYLWAFALFVTIGQTIDFVVMRWAESYRSVVWLGIASMAVCIVQFSLGRAIGKKCGDKVAGGQMLAQKNSAMGIWMLNSFLNPVASVGMAFYSIWQNLFNSWQIFRASRLPQNR